MPDISYAGSPFTFTKNSLVSGATPTNVGGAPDAWAIDPEISTTIPGLSFNTATGAITGTPTGVHSATTFTVWANNSAVIFRQPFRSPFKMKQPIFRTQVHRLHSPRTVL